MILEGAASTKHFLNFIYVDDIRRKHSNTFAKLLKKFSTTDEKIPLNVWGTQHLYDKF
jgi:hypothetical protein